MSGRNGMVDAANEGRARGNRPVAAPAPSWSPLARRAALSLALGLLPNRMAVAQAPLVLATSTPGGGLSRFADALLTELSGGSERWLSHPATAGSAENIRLLGNGAADGRSWPAKRRRTHSPVRTPRWSWRLSMARQ